MARDGRKHTPGVTTTPGGDAGEPRGDSFILPSDDGASTQQADVSRAGASGGRYVPRAAETDVAAAGPLAVSDRRRASRIQAVNAASCLTAEVSAGAVRHNLSLLRSLVPAGTEICAAVKADSYGHGLDILVNVIGERVEALAVATAAEALRIRELGYGGEVLMLFPPGPHAPAALLTELIVADVTLTISSHAEVLPVSRAARLAGRRVCVHAKVDTGMGRGGVAWGEAAELVRRIRRVHSMGLRGLYTHLACADEADKTAAYEQMATFFHVVQACGRSDLTLHAANSAALIDMPATHLNMVRPGIAVYGYQSSDEMVNRPDLRPALRVTGRLVQVKDAAEGSRCGYGLTHTFDRPSRIGIVPVGYADGYLRSFSNRATMRIAGLHVPVRGRVSMDQTIIDLTDVPQARAGDEVEIISPDPSAPHSVENLARLAGTIPYEITCHLGNRVKRTLVE